MTIMIMTEINPQKKDGATPGSNWEKYKKLVTAQVTVQENVPKKKKRKRRTKPAVLQESNESVPEAPEPAEGTEKKVKKRRNRNRTKPITPIKEDKTSPPVVSTIPEITKVVAMDCEMVGINDGQDSMVARVSMVNSKGQCIYDKYVKPTEMIQDYRTEVSGIRPHHLQSGENFKVVQKEVSDILRGRILVGHALHNDLQVLYLAHPKRHLRDTSRYKPFRSVANGSTPSLKKLASELLGLDIQSGEHNSVEDAKAALQIYMLFKKKWEADLRKKNYRY